MSRSSSWLAPMRPVLLMGSVASVASIATVAALASVAACGIAMAEVVDPARSTGKTRPPPVESMARIPDEAGRSVLRCWQEGRLVFEGTGIGNESSATAAARTFKGNNGRTVQLLDLRQGLCILERSNG
jgi:hypothetical protein